MKKLICLFIMLTILWLMALRVDAPPNPTLPIVESKALHPYGITDPVLLAFIRLESLFDQYAENPRSKARGIFQITKVMIREVNRIIRKQEIELSKRLGYPITLPKYTWDDAWDPIKSIEMWWIAQNYHNPEYNILKACRIWFGTGKQYDEKTWKWYYKTIESYLSN